MSVVAYSGRIDATNPYSSSGDFDVAYDHGAEAAIEALLLGHSVSKVAEDHLLLDDGTLLRLVGNEGGCSCGGGDYDLTELNDVDNIITAVEFEVGDGADYFTAYRIFVLAGDKRINLATFEGDDGSGYYGTGYYVMVRRPAAEPGVAADSAGVPR
ncbi:hypothetical protein DDP54_15770 (plasmid) [Cellulomonas sp. WB94]|nr:hypothetical protein DDP54_15770 [Cellulomonas sp. WB94]